MPNAFLRKLNSLVPLTEGDTQALTGALGRSRSYSAKEDIIREGDEPGPILIMLEGWASRYKILPSGSRQIMAFLMPGDACDVNVGLLAEMDHSIQTLTASKVATISQAEMEALMYAHPRIARAIYIAQLVDEGTLRAWIVSMGRRSSIERVAHLLCELFLRANTIGLVSDGDLVLPLSQIVLSDALGMTPVHINRVLKDLRKAEAIELRRGSVAIRDPAKLVRVAGFDENYLHRRMRVNS